MQDTPASLRHLKLRLPSPLEELKDDTVVHSGIRLYVKRDDLIHPEIVGNKWRKLHGNLAEARGRGCGTLLTFGGAYSNHIRAAAAAGYYFGFRTIGVIRGEEHSPLNPSLQYAASRGMHLVYMDRSTYRAKDSQGIIATLHERFGDFYLIPEGGSNEIAVRHCRQITEEINIDFDVICCSVGTGGTLAGIAAGLRDGQRAIGFSALKGGQFLTDAVEQLQRQAFGSSSSNWTIELDYHFGGFARTTPALNGFIDAFAAQHRIELDKTYVGKMMYGIYELITTSYFPRGTAIVAVVTG